MEKMWVTLRALLGHFHPSGIDDVLSPLAQEEAQKVLVQEVGTDKVEFLFTQPEERIKEIHYSWLETPFTQLPDSLRPYFFVSLPATYQKGLAQRIEISKLPENVSPFVRRFLLLILYKQLGTKEVLPLEFIPERPLTPFAKLQKSDMLDVVDLLGLYDLAAEVKMVIDKSVLKKLYGSLSKIKIAFLRKILHKPNRLSLPPLGLELWQGNQKKLEKELHRRGMIRLGKALCGVDTQIVWHILHKFDKGRSAFITRHSEGAGEEGLHRALVMQVLEAVNFQQNQKGGVENGK